ncbi:hypothetical protein QYE76_001277 [Lolium multiflorum]|uniref:Ribonuclease H1 N-terminal domain-containing protein n=1 Tax=Lolium multiflorum TaxID=4521 RepID=A0AAD8RLR2_LOLMU|nr:hypothetical protein QYE76_001277 [Lolium multiflorum]
MKIKRETPDVAIAIPTTCVKATALSCLVRLRYLEKCFLDNKRKDNILLAYFPEDTYCVLISIAQYSLATYFDSGVRKKNYENKPENSTLDAFYVMHHLKGFVRDSQNLLLPSALRGWAEKLARINDDDLREDFHDTRVKLSHIIIQDVTTGGGPLNQGRARGTSNTASKRRVTRGQMPTYVVYKGRVPGVYEERQDCLEQVHKFSGNSYKGYATREEAVAQWRAHVGKKKNRLKFLVPLLLTATAVVLYFTLV